VPKGKFYHFRIEKVLQMHNLCTYVCINIPWFSQWAGFLKIHIKYTYWKNYRIPNRNRNSSFAFYFFLERDNFFFWEKWRMLLKKSHQKLFEWSFANLLRVCEKVFDNLHFFMKFLSLNIVQKIRANIH